MGWQIAIDGPAASGKSTVAKAISKNLGFEYLDTGAMYRAVTLKALRLGINLEDENEYKFLENTTMSFENNEIILDGVNVSREIRQSEVTNNASLVSKFGYVREKLVDMQRELASTNNIIMDGRDIGTVVLPNANLKIFLVANVKTRAERRQLEEIEKYGSSKDLETLINEIEARDYKDSHREISPLKQANDAILIDTSNYSVQEVIDMITKLVFKRGYSMENLENKNEIEKVEEQVEDQPALETEEAKEVAEEVVAPEEAPVEEASEEAEESAAAYKEMQVVKGTVIEVQDATEERKDKNGNVVRKATEERVLIQLEDGQEGYLFRKDTADILDDELLFDKFIEGDQVEVAIKKIFPDGGRFIFSTLLVEKRQQLLDFEATVKERPILVAKVIKQIKFGLLLKYEDFTCLLPKDLMVDPEADKEALIGKEIEVCPIRIDLPRIRIIVSESHAANKKAREAKKEFLSKIEVGQVYEGTVKNVETYGAFVELAPGIEGLLHISEVDHNRVSKIEKILNTGDTVKVQVIKVEKEHIGLSRKALLPNYWGDFFQDKAIGDVVTGTVLEIGNSGVKINLATEVDGFVPKSEYSWEKELKLEEALKVGDEITGKLLEVEKAKKRIIVSVKQLSENPWETVTLKAGDNIDVQIVNKNENGFKVSYKGINGFMSNKSVRGIELDSIEVGSTQNVKVTIFDTAKQKLYVCIGEFEPKVERETKDYSKFMKSNDKMTSTFGDLLKEKEGK